MFQMALAFLLFAIGSLADAEPLSLGDVRAKNGVQLSAEELKQLMPGARVVNLSAGGSTRRWQNDVNGKLVASSRQQG